MANSFKCEVRTSDYSPFVTKMIEADPAKYSNFNEVAAFILSAPLLSNEQKMLGLYNTAIIFEGLAALDKERYTSGKSNQIIGLSSSLTDPTMFLSRVSDLFPNTQSAEIPKTFQELIDSIESFFGDSEIVDRNALKSKLDQVGYFFKTAEFGSDAERISEGNAALDSIIAGIDALSDLNQKSLLKRMVEDFREDLSDITGFVSLRDIADLASLKNHIITLPDGRIVEATRTEEGTFIYLDRDETGNSSPVEVTAEELLEIEQAHTSEMGYHAADNTGNSFQHVFFGDTIGSALKIVTRKGSERLSTRESIIEALGSLSDQRGQVKITVKRVSNIAKDRVERIRTAGSDPNIAGVSRRNHETFENKAQENYLKRTPGGKILTLARPDEGFFIEGEILSTGEKFRLYSFDNYAFVYADNFTEKVDFSNPEHLQEIKRLSVNKDNGMSALTDADIAVMRKSHETAQAFFSKLQDLAGENTSFDATEEFFNHFSFGQPKQKEAEIPLDQDPEFELLMHDVPIVNVDAQGRIVEGSERQKAVPFFFTKQKGEKVFGFRSSLAPNEKIVTPDGRAIELDGYIEFLGITQASLRAMFSSEQKFLDATSIVLKSKPDGTYTFRIMRPKNITEDLGVFGQYVTELAAVLSLPAAERRAALDKFEKERFTFKIYTPTSAEGNTLMLSHSTDSYGTLRLRMKPGVSRASGVATGRYQEMIGKDDAPLFNFPLDPKPIVNLAKAWSLQGKIGQQLVAELKEAGVDLSQFDVSPSEKFPSSPAAVRNFTRWLQDQVNEGKGTPSSKIFLDSIQKAMHDFGTMLKTSVTDKLVAKLQAERPDILEEMKKHFSVDGEFRPEFLIVDQDESGNLIPKIRYHEKNNVGKEDYHSRISNYKVLRPTVIEGRTTVLAKGVPAKTEMRPKVTSETIPATPVTPVNPVQAPVADSKSAVDVIPGAIRPTNVPLELSQGSVETETSEQRQTAISWLKENYPQFGIEEGDLSELLDLASINGEVLGAFANRVVYLNSALQGKGTVYHEAFHGVFRHLMNTGERRLLLDTVINDKKNKGRFTEASLKEFAEARNLNLSNEAIRDLIAEEILAEGFQSFMGEKSSQKPGKQGKIAKFFEMLKKLINMMLKRRSVIEEFYTKVGNGQFSARTMESGLFDNQTAYEIIPGIIKHRKQDGQIVSTPHVMDDIQRKQLVTMVAGMMLRDNPELSFEERFDRVSKRLVEDEFNMQRLLDQKAKSKDGLTPEIRQKIIDRYGLMFANYAFILGGRMNGNVPDVNLTGDPQFDNFRTENTVTSNGEVVDNFTGSHSREILKKQVAAEIAMLSKMVEERFEEDDSEKDLAVVDQELQDGKFQKKTPDGYDEANDEVDGGGDFEAAMNEFNRMDSLNRQLRMFLSNIRADVYDAELGITVPRVVNAERVFSVLLKLSANIEPRFIMPNLKMSADQMREDGNFDVAAELYAIYNTMDEMVAFDSAGYPTQNEYLYNMLVDVLHGTEEALIMVNPYTKVTDVDGNDEVNTNSVTVKDKVLSNDTWVKKRSLVSQIVLTQGEAVTDPAKMKAYTAAVEELKQVIENIKSGKFLGGTMTLTPEMQLNALTDTIKTNLDKVGLEVPKSLIRLSLIAIYKNDFGGQAELGEKADLLYNVNLGFVQEKAFLEQDFWRDLEKVLNTAVNSTQSRFKGFLDDINISNSNLNRFNAILGNASAYIVKYDPDMLPTTVKNAEGKAVFRYTKYTAIRTILEDVRKYGLEASLEKDPYWGSYLKEFIADNTWLNGKTDKQKANMKLFLSKMDMALFGGVQQKINGQNQEGKGFKDLDERSLYLSFVMMFMDRKKYNDNIKNFDEDGNLLSETEAKVETFMRPFSQLEASQTHYVVSGLYVPFVSRTGETRYSVDGQNFGYMVKVLEDTVKQEFERMTREFSRKDARKEAFDNRTGNELILNFNAVYDKNDSAVAEVNPEVAKNLRAYKFNKLEDFFGTAQGAEFADTLRAQAFSGKSFSELDVEVKNELRKALQAYADKQVENHLNKLVSIGAVNLSTDQSTGQINFLSPYLPDHIKYAGGEKVSLVDLYGPNPYKNFLKDAFFNVWANSLMLNDIFDGDKAMSVKNAIEYFKRNKKHLAASSNMKEGYHKVAYTNTIYGYVYSKHPEFGNYSSEQEIMDDPSLSLPMKLEMIADYQQGNGREKIFDGQSVSTIMHQMDMMESIGRLDQKSKALMIAKHYRELTEDEIAHLKSMNIVLNAKKTVTAARFNYHKLSEVHIDRNDVSMMVVPDGMTRNEVNMYLQYLYERMYSKRKQLQRSQISGEDGSVKEIREELKKIAEEIHTFFQPLPHRIKLHELLNSMEYFQIDQMMDTEASKNATLLPMDLVQTPKFNTGNGNAYLNLEHSAIDVENRFKYMQVETSGVKDKAKFSVQSKALLPADLLNIKDLLIAQNGTLTAEEEESFALVGDILENYQSTLKDVAVSMSTKFKTFLRKDGDFDIAKVYQMIRESLVEQNAPSNRIALFDLNADGQPKYSPNLPAIRNMLEYYFFSQYSKNVTDEKGAGFKNIHISGYGYEVLVDKNDQVIPTHIYKNNPEKFPGARSRSLKTAVETDANGVKTYFMEVLVPRPKFESREHEAFYMKNLSKMFGTRIPTEDKRSMVALKVVDFIDSANASGIVVPHAVHMLSGSDFDVDALYGQVKAFYKDFNDQFHVYGEYGQSKKEEIKTKRFIEFVSYFASDKELSPLIKQRFNEVIAEIENSGKVDLGRGTYDILKSMGYSREAVDSMIQLARSSEDYKRAFEMTKEQYESNKPFEMRINDFITDVKVEIETERAKKEPSEDKIDKLEGELKRYMVMKSQFSATKRDMITSRAHWQAAENAKKVFKIQATADVFSKYGLPVTEKGFYSRPEYANMITAVSQNKNLDAKINIISNEMVFKNLYIEERSSVKEFKKVMDAYGLKIADVSSNSNAYTMDAVISTKKTTSMNKDGIGITANLNKFLALASTYQLELKNPIWNMEMNGTRKYYSRFGGLNEDNQRTIALIGNILGMFADGAKEPIPAALRMNEYNATVTLAMIGVGLDPKFAFGFNFLPEVQRAVMAVQASDTAIGYETDNDLKRLEAELREQIIDLVRGDQNEIEKLNAQSEKAGKQPAGISILTELENAGLLRSGSDVFRGLDILSGNLKVDFQAKPLNKARLNNLELEPGEIGYTVSSTQEDAMPLSQEAQKLILLELYRKQAQQTNEMRKSGAVINLFKSLNPSFTSFDAMVANITQTMDPTTSIFTEESVDKLRDESQVWPVLIEMMHDLDRQSQKLFLERGGFLGKIKELFMTVIQDPAEISQTLTSFVGLNAFLSNYPGSRFQEGIHPDFQEFFNRDDENLKEVFTPDFWFHSGKEKTDKDGRKILTIGEELDRMKKLHPENSFLNSIVEKKEVLSTYYNTATKQNEQVTMNYITLAGTSKKNNVEQIQDDFNKLLLFEKFGERLFLKKLFYHELARTAMMGTSGSFLQFMSPELYLPISREIEKFATGLKRDGNVLNNLKASLGIDNDQNLAEMFDNMFMQLVYKAVENPKNKKVPTAKQLHILTEKVQNIYKTFETQEKFDKKNIALAARLAAQVYDHVFGFMISKAEKIVSPVLDISAKDPNIVKNGLRFNLKLPNDDKTFMTGKTMEFVARQFGIKKSMKPGTEGQYDFPVIIRIKDGFLKLRQVDTRKPMESTGHAIMNALRYDSDFTFSGMSAKYDFLPAKSVPGFLSPIGFSKTAMERFQMLQELGKKRQGTSYTPVQTPVSQAPVAPAPEKVVAPEVSEEFNSEDASFTTGLLKGLIPQAPAAPVEQTAAPVRVAKMSSKESPLEVFVDGNDFKGSGNMGYGAGFKFNSKWYTLSGTENSDSSHWLKGKHPDAKWSNPTTELMGTVAVLHTFRNTAEHIVIKQDFNGIVNWGELWNYSEGSAQRAAKPWKINEPYIKTLHDQAVRLIKQIEANGGSVRLQWVKGHNGIEGNEIADQAAKNREIFNEFVNGIEDADRLASDMNSLNMTPAVLNAVYNASSMKMTRDEFERTALQIVAALRATKSPTEIIEQLKCL